MYNVTAYIHELLTGTRYTAVEQSEGKERVGEHATIEEVEEVDEEGDSSTQLPSTEAVKDSETAGGEERKTSSVEDTGTV